ncbi:MAG TPA: hypothetical protein VF132_05335 [Rudaea sp.]
MKLGETYVSKEQSIAGLYALVAILCPAICTLAAAHPEREVVMELFAPQIARIRQVVVNLDLCPELEAYCEKLLQGFMGALE